MDHGYMSVKRLVRPAKNRIIAGVCAGVGEYLGIDPPVIRLLFTIGSLFLLIWKPLWCLFSPAAYLLAWLVVPPEGRGSEEACSRTEEKSSTERSGR